MRATLLASSCTGLSAGCLPESRRKFCGVAMATRGDPPDWRFQLLLATEAVSSLSVQASVPGRPLAWCLQLLLAMDAVSSLSVQASILRLTDAEATAGLATLLFGDATSGVVA